MIDFRYFPFTGWTLFGATGSCGWITHGPDFQIKRVRLPSDGDEEENEEFELYSGNGQKERG